MPQLNGIELSERMKAGYPEAKFLFITGFADQFPELDTWFKKGADIVEKAFFAFRAGAQGGGNVEPAAPSHGYRGIKCFSNEVAGLDELAIHLPSQGSEWSLAFIENASSRSEAKMKSSFSWEARRRDRRSQLSFPEWKAAVN